MLGSPPLMDLKEKQDPTPEALLAAVGRCGGIRATPRSPSADPLPTIPLGPAGTLPLPTPIPLLASRRGLPLQPYLSLLRLPLGVAHPCYPAGLGSALHEV